MREKYTSPLGRVSPNLVTGNARKPSNSFRRVFCCTSDSSPILLFCHQKAQLIFLDPPQEDARRQMIEMYVSILLFGAIWCHCAKNAVALFDTKN